MPNFLIINKLSALPANIVIYKRDYSGFDDSVLTRDKLNRVENVLPSNNDVNESFDTFLTQINQIIDKLIPMKRLTRKEIKTMTKPWITSGIKTSIKFKNKLFKKYVTTKNLYHHSKYKTYRNKLNTIIKTNKTYALQ